MVAAARHARFLAWIVFAVIACTEPRSEREGTDSPVPAATPADTVPPDSVVAPGAVSDTATAEWTAGIVRREHAVDGVATVTTMRVAGNDGFDRFVLEFDDRRRLPAYHVEYVDRPVRQCGSGDVVDMLGDAWLLVRLEPAQAHDEHGRATIEQRNVRPGLPVVLQARLICDFEAQVEWVLGVAVPNRYRVLELSDPARLVIDVRRR